ncbi:MAG: gfo/Idh/MocA family oxidoreductase [Alphaproteobacteria bacterium]|nr:gfo/Idh/MocA family oxidoreductase [Alphaproteobacteria bacterium]
MTRTLRFAAIGLGQRIAAVLRAVKQTGAHFALAGYVDPAPVGSSILGENGIALGRRFEDERELLAAGPYDLLLIGSPNHLHAAQLAAALDDGRSPIFVEKPIVRTEAESYALAARLRETTTPLFVGLVMRSAPIVREVLRTVDSGELGEIVSIDATEHLPPDHGAYLARNWRRKSEWGGSFLLDKVCHDFDILDAVAGARAARVASFGGRGSFRADRARGHDRAAYRAWPGGWAAQDDPFSSDPDVTDTQTAIVEYENGVKLAFHASSHSALRERRWYIAGTEGTLIADIDRNKLMWRHATDPGAPVRATFPLNAIDHNGADVAMAGDLIAALAKRAAFPVTATQALEAGLTVMAIDKAMGSGQIVDCSEMWRTFDQARG